MEDYRDPADRKRGRGRKVAPSPVVPDLFSQTPIHTMHRHPDRETSVEAAERATQGSQRLKAMIYEAFLELGPMTDGELEKLERFAGKPINSIRKRRTDLLQEGRLEDTGERRGHPDRPNSRMMVWRIPEMNRCAVTPPPLL